MCPVRIVDAGSTAGRSVVVNLLDTPGNPDFTGELRAGLRAADAALFVVSAADDVDPITVALWEECAALGTPRAVVITRLDAPRASLTDALAACQQHVRRRRRAGGTAAVPAGRRRRPHALVGLLTRTVYDYSAGFPPAQSPLDDAVAVEGDVASARAALIEAIIDNSEDETLLERYLGGEDIGVDVLIADLETAVARGTFYPVIPVCAATGLGLAELLELLVGGFPSPAELDPPRPRCSLDGTPGPALAADPDGPLVGEIVRTTVDPYQGRLSVVRLFSGTLLPETPVHVSGHGGAARGHPDHDVDERVGQIFSPLGAQLRPVERAVAGDICAISRLGTAETGDTVSAKAEPLLVEAWDMPEPLLPVAVQAATRADEDALAKALARLTAGDPTRARRAQRRDRAAGAVVPGRGARRRGARAAARHRRRGGDRAAADRAAPDVRGRGPRPRPAGQAVRRARAVRRRRRRRRAAAARHRACSSASRWSAARCRRSSSRSVEKGVRAAARARPGQRPRPGRRRAGHAGRRQGAQRRLLRRRLPDRGGSGAEGRRLPRGAVVLLEPLADVDVTVPDAHVGAVHVATCPAGAGGSPAPSPMPARPPGWSAPSCTPRCPTRSWPATRSSLRSLTAGTGRFRRRFARYEVVPSTVAAGLRERVGGRRALTASFSGAGGAPCRTARG